MPAPQAFLTYPIIVQRFPLLFLLTRRHCSDTFTFTATVSGCSCSTPPPRVPPPGGDSSGTCFSAAHMRRRPPARGSRARSSQSCAAPARS
eukprot:6730669-Pyramimonas_sp.AAC.1